MNEPIRAELAEYLETLVPERHPELLAMEDRARRDGFPIIGPAAGQACYLLARISGAKSIFEMGSGFGYSTAWFARAVRENGGGTVHHVVWDEDLSRQARDHLRTLDLLDLVTFTVGEAVDTLRRTERRFDLIFCDIEKRDYPDALPVIEDRIEPGGVLIIDNMLWFGRIFDPHDRSPDTEGVREFTRRITADRRWEITLLPIRDGLIVARRAD